MFASRGASKLRATTRLLVRSLASRASSDYSSSWQPLLAGTAAVMTAATILSYPNNKTVLEASTPTIDSSSPDDSFVGATTLLNWSGTHAVHTKNFWEPETMQELEELIQECHNKGKAVRPLGSALSPNGIGFQSAGMVSLANLDEILVYLNN